MQVLQDLGLKCIKPDELSNFIKKNNLKTV
jgi:hypothetical protein